MAKQADQNTNTRHQQTIITSKQKREEKRCEETADICRHSLFLEPLGNCRLARVQLYTQLMLNLHYYTELPN